MKAGQQDNAMTPRPAQGPAMTADWVVGAVTFEFDCELAFVGPPGDRSAGLAVKTDP